MYNYLLTKKKIYSYLPQILVDIKWRIDSHIINVSHESGDNIAPPNHCLKIKRSLIRIMDN